MSDFDKSRAEQSGKGVPASRGPENPPRQRWSTRSWSKAASVMGKARERGLGRGWLVAVVLVVLVVPISAAIIGYFTKPAPGTAASLPGSSGSPGSATKPKPAAGKPFVPVEEPVPVNPAPQIAIPVAPQNPVIAVAPRSLSTSPGSTSTPAPMATAPPPPNVTTKVPYAPAIYRARHDKVFGDACSGQLTLNSSELVFNCPEDPHDSLQVAIDEIGSVDGNGIRLMSGKKYHFSIPGMTKSSEEQLFVDWLTRVR
jgi:hypothetical protein